MNRKAALYMFLAILPSLTQPTAAPADEWEWFKYAGLALYQGLLALKAFQSQPAGDAGDPLQVVTPPGEPLEVTQTTTPKTDPHEQPHHK